MNKTKQRIAIAEACGWTDVDLDDGEPWGFAPGEERDPKDITSVHGSWVPDYLNDLNAMHEAEESMTEVQLSLYAHHMIRSVRHAKGIPDHESRYPVPFVLRATAEQRCEAFLRTLGLWEG